MPEANCSYINHVMRHYKTIDINVAVSIADGLITPLLRDVDKRGLVSLNGQMKELIVKSKEGKLLPLEGDWSMEKIRLIRQQAKQKVFVTNAIRALTRVSPTGNVRDIQFVVLVGGSALDFEVPQMVTDALSQYKVVAGRGNIRGTEGPRNAVATGLVLSLTEGRG